MTYEQLLQFVDDQCGLECGRNGVYMIDLPMIAIIDEDGHQVDEYEAEPGDLFYVSTNDAGVEENEYMVKDLREVFGDDVKVRNITATGFAIYGD